MSRNFSRRSFLKLGGLSLAGLAFDRFAPDFTSFDDGDIVRVAAKDYTVIIYTQPSDKSIAYRACKKNELLHVYEEITADEPKPNPIWYRVWGGYVWRARLQPVKNLLNIPLTSIPGGARLLAEVTVPFSMPRRFSKASGWAPDPLGFPLYYESVYWIEAIVEGPDGQPWY